MRKEYLSGIVWTLVSIPVFWWLGSWSTPVTILWEIAVILLVITVVFCSFKRFKVPDVKPLTDRNASGRAPAPRDELEKQVQKLGFHHLGDFEATVVAGMSTGIRAYVDPDRLCAAMLVDMTSNQGKTTILEFCTKLQPSGGITTTMAPHPNIFAYPRDRIRANVPWKKTAAEVHDLHQSLCRTAIGEKFTPATIYSAGFAESIREDTRNDYEYQVKVGRLKRVVEGQYQLTWLESVIAAPLIWYQMAYGHLFSWFSLPDGFFCWKLRRRLRRARPRTKGAIFIACREDNDLYRTLCSNNVACERRDTAQEALDLASAKDAVLILADGYPDSPTEVPVDLLEQARRRAFRWYIEFPAALPGLEVQAPRSTQWERAVIASERFGAALPAGRIVMLHGCRYVPMSAGNPLIVLARIAGFNTAVYGLPADSQPVLFEHPDGHGLVATTKLSQFITARYAPAAVCQTIWSWILNWLSPDAECVTLDWMPTVCPSYPAHVALPPESERQALQRGAAWFHKAKLLIHPDWLAEVNRMNDGGGVGPGPAAGWPEGDGQCGLLEGVSSQIHADGSQDWRYLVRSDCVAETAMALAMAGVTESSAADRQVAANLADFLWHRSPLAQGPRADPASPSYGLLCWTMRDKHGGIYYGDDNARAMLGTMATSALLQDPRWDERLLRCLLANLRTTGVKGFRGHLQVEDELQAKGWRYYWERDLTNFAPHFESWLWACHLWAFARTGLAPFRDRAESGIRLTMGAYPDKWQWTNGIQQERARMLLPLSWLVRTADTPEHRGWLRFMAEQLLAAQDPCGAIREEIGSAGMGSYAPPATNEAYGTSEAPLIQQNGDPLCDLLYTTNFALLGLHEAAAATGEPFYREAEDRLVDFLCRIQVRSERHAGLDGAWFRAFDYRQWDYWASNADIGWGAWSIESGWTQGWIVTVLGLRLRNTSFWELTAGSRIAAGADAQWNMI